MFCRPEVSFFCSAMNSLYESSGSDMSFLQSKWSFSCDIATWFWNHSATLSPYRQNSQMVSSATQTAPTRITGLGSIGIYPVCVLSRLEIRATGEIALLGNTIFLVSCVNRLMDWGQVVITYKSNDCRLLHFLCCLVLEACKCLVDYNIIVFDLVKSCVWMSAFRFVFEHSSNLTAFSTCFMWVSKHSRVLFILPTRRLNRAENISIV